MSATIDPILLTTAEIVLTHGYGGEVPTAGYPDTGTWLIFGIILMPVYVMVAAWFLGAPRDTKSALMGVGYLVSITTGLWLSMFIGMEIVGLVFY
ncbi:hypothetical protein [Halostagnicola sp. A-GB9-2]|uniref:hypothetical protein n=1 Tax=Halostagnicola sp. A-GB9-2 TaxID=3048066 RepID=UPI0024C029FF|nr:hypothetical protein [Halostagnicola sp. A-GB9-2]MDJ1434534.1 hypothetical protein [Halostagnicola sp. A-GB9-2]